MDPKARKAIDQHTFKMISNYIRSSLSFQQKAIEWAESIHDPQLRELAMSQVRQMNLELRNRM
jgi:hypothetical protein